MARGTGGDRRRDLVEVELFEDALEPPSGSGTHDEGGGGGGATATPEPRGAAGAPRGRTAGPGARRRRALGWAAAAATVGFVVGANVVAERREAVRLAALADVPGVLAPLDGPLTEQWRADASWLLVELADVLVVGSRDGAGVRGIDPTTGAETWRFGSTSDGEPLYCTVGSSGRGTSEDPGTSGPLLCVEGSRHFLGHPAGRETTVSLIDPLTGAVSATVDIDGSLLTAEVVDGDPVVATATADGRVEARRLDGGSGEEVWTYRSKRPVAGEYGNRVSQTSLGEDVLRVDGTGSVAVDLRTGAVTEPSPLEAGFGEPWTGTAPLIGGAVAEWTVAPTGELEEASVVEADGTVRFTLPGPPWYAPLHDGSVPEVLVVRPPGSDLHGIDASTGETRWVADGGGLGFPVLQVDGVLVGSSGQAATAVDVRDGSLLWSVLLDPAVGTTVLTDGRVVLLQRAEDGRAILAAHGIRDGVEHWRLDLPTGTYGVMPTRAGTLVAFTGQALVGLG